MTVVTVVTVTVVTVLALNGMMTITMEGGRVFKEFYELGGPRKLREFQKWLPIWRKEYG